MRWVAPRESYGPVPESRCRGTRCHAQPGDRKFCRDGVWGVCENLPACRRGWNGLELNVGSASRRGRGKQETVSIRGVTRRLTEDMQDESMNAYKTYVKVGACGRVVLEHLPFPKGALVEVLVVDQRTQPGEVENWRALFKEIQALPQSQAMTDTEIAKEIENYRSGR